MNGKYEVWNGEPGGARTRDHRIKSAMLYQLSYRLKHNQDSMLTLFLCPPASPVEVMAEHRRVVTRLA
jgi:hypothetical protein